MAVPKPACAGGSGHQLVRKPTRWMSSSPEILKRVCLRCRSEGLPASDPKLHEHAVLRGRDSSGENLTARAA
eukprot:8216093-Alexandrium_andersonii.AAC.1